jgi:hypothetical protein
MNEKVKQYIGYIVIFMTVAFAGCLTIFAYVVRGKADIIYVDRMDSIYYKDVSRKCDQIIDAQLEFGRKLDNYQNARKRNQGRNTGIKK